jgi:hypothetical protein
MQIIYDVFPAHFSIAAPDVYTDVHDMTSSPPPANAFYLGTTRIILTEDEIIVAQDAAGGPQIMFKEKYVSFEKSQKVDQDSYVVTVNNKTIAFKKDTNCGCGSTLRGWNPYRTLNSTRNPSA